MPGPKPAFSVLGAIGNRNGPRKLGLQRSPTMNSAEKAPHRVVPRRAVIGGALAAVGWCVVGVGRAQAAAPEKLEKSEEEWQELLTPAQYYVLRQSGTERPFSSPLNNEKRRGVFDCAACSHPLFSSSHKYNSGTGWPSFYRTLPDAVVLIETSVDRFLFQKEVRCARCEGHLGHVFPDGPRPTGKRFCMNGVALRFEPRDG